MSVDKPVICTYAISEKLAQYTTLDRDLLKVDIPIPLPEFSDVDEYVAVFGSRGLFETVNEVDLRNELVRFVHDETQRIQDERGDELIKNALESGFELPDCDPSPHLVIDQSEDFANKFSFIMRNSPSHELAELMRRQISMMNEMSQIIRVRNWDVAELTNKCENAVNDASFNADVHPHQLSNLNEKLRNLHASYACQVEVLCEKQRKEFRDMVDTLYNGGSILDGRQAAEDIPELTISSTKTTTEEQGINECYTIYIGAQLKSMHNVRLLTAKSMVDLCTPVKVFKGADVGSLLQMSISLYGRQLSALIMLVPRDPLWHSSSGSKFARVCEQSTELHFDPLPKQLKNVLESTIRASQWREESASERSKSSEWKESPRKPTHETTLETGDVYCTRHSNLRDVQLVFHLVVDDALRSSDISSPNMTIAWCMRRAEMVYKCVKGYLMEVCGVCGGSAVGGGVTVVPHYNIHFVLPSGLADGVYQQISAMTTFLPLIARYSPEHRRALAALCSDEEEDLIAELGALEIVGYNGSYTMHPDGNSLQLPNGGENTNEDVPLCGDAGTFTFGAESKPKKIEYLTFTPDSLNHISRQASIDLREKYTQTGENYNLAFKMAPEYFVTPRDVSLLETAMEYSMADLTFIVKPVSSSQGKGIFFANKPTVSGKLRVASEKYCSEVDTQDAFVHLTNYSINKNNTNFVRNESMASEDFGHKWTLGALLRHIEKEGMDAKMLMLRIEDVIVKSLLSVQTRITSACRTTTPHVGTNFELFGFDILVDEDLKPWLLEVNLSPSLSCDAPLDSLVKSRLICDLFNLACVPLVNRKLAGIQLIRPSKEDDCDSDDAEVEAERTKKISPSKRGFNIKRRRVRTPFSASPYAPDPSMRAICRRARAEMSRRGGFVRIFPREHSLQLYRGVMERIGSENRDERLYYKEYGFEEEEDNTEQNENSLAKLYHDVMMDSSIYPTLDSVPPELREVLRGWYNDANAYTQRITKDGEKYAARLPVVRPSARLRTKSCSEWYEVKKATIAEAKLKLQQQQEEMKMQDQLVDQKEADNKENATPAPMLAS
ncbi:Tubulin-tyrosine ligase family protein [Ancylostoma ceylanicum]|uniref:Tubulin-tyrosine ligase family protein n=1 Tax=Ancylostoma ceylanicum TaxID=53326 RepID=A0A0D6M3J9_9BILA|nr:Tubulin-tyrosine ligase family protein [Ancylostoma ceylanicum]